MRAKEIFFPMGTYGKKARYLYLGFELMGEKVTKAEEDVEMAVVPFIVRSQSGRAIKCALDVRIDNDKILKEADGETFYFKTHIKTALIDHKRRIFPMPQSLGRMEFVEAIDKLRIARARGTLPAIDVFGVFQGGGMREKAVRIAKSDEWKAVVGIYKPRSRGVVVAKEVRCAPLPPAAYFRDMAAARVALSFSSHASETNPGPWCSFRHVEAWSLGVPMVTTPPDGYYVFGCPDRCWIETKPDLSDLFEKIEWTLENPVAAEAIGRRGMAYFDEYLKPKDHAAYVMETIEDAID